MFLQACFFSAFSLLVHTAAASLDKNFLRKIEDVKANSRDRITGSVFLTKENVMTTILPNSGGFKTVARGEYFINAQNTGFNYLSVEYDSNQEFDYVTTMRAAGFIEGSLTCEEIRIFYPNFYADSFGDEEIPGEVANFIKQNYNWVQEQASKGENAYWHTIRGLLAQMDGILEGYAQSNCGQNSTFDLQQLLYMNAWY